MSKDDASRGHRPVQNALRRSALVFFIAPLGCLASQDSPADAKPKPLFATASQEALLTESGASFTVYRDVLYPGAAGEHRADVYLPKNAQRPANPALLLIHGGGWAAGDKAGRKQVEFAEFAIELGCVVVSINYSLTKFADNNPRQTKLRAGWPNNILDCKGALRWMKANAAHLGLDPQRIGVLGESAGCHLALLLGLSDRNEELNAGGTLFEGDHSVRCIIDFYGIPDLRRFEGYSLFSEQDRRSEKALALASPVEYLRKDSPPVLILHGSLDTDVEPALSEDFAAKAKQVEAQCDYVPVERAGHGFGLKPAGTDLRPLVRAFLQKHL